MSRPSTHCVGEKRTNATLAWLTALVAQIALDGFSNGEGENPLFFSLTGLTFCLLSLAGAPQAGRRKRFPT